MFKQSPIVVIRVPERQSGKSYADVTGAVRQLADVFGLRVLVDGSPNSIPPELMATIRENVIIVDPMSKEQIESIPEFRGLIDFLKSRNLDELVWKVLGGCPARYVKLGKDVKVARLNNASDEAVEEVVKKHIRSVLYDAFSNIVRKSSTNTKVIVKLFREKGAIRIPIQELEEKGLSLEYPNKVFGEVNISDCSFVEPSTAAVSLIISENVRDDNGVHKLLDELLKAPEKK